MDAKQSDAKERKLRRILRQVKKLACEYYHLTGKPLGVTGEVAEYEAASKLKLKLTVARHPGFDASTRRKGKVIRYQIKGRVVDEKARYKGRLSRISRNAKFDRVLLILLSKKNFDTLEIWQLSRKKVLAKLKKTVSRARQRGQLAIADFKSGAEKIWPAHG